MAEKEATEPETVVETPEVTDENIGDDRDDEVDQDKGYAKRVRAIHREAEKSKAKPKSV